MYCQRERLWCYVVPPYPRKSAFAASHFHETEDASHPTCAGNEIFDSKRTLRINRDTFDLFHLIIEKRLKLGRFTVADSTALQVFARRELLERAQAAQFTTCLLLFDVPMSICMQRDKQRTRPVPFDVIVSQYEQFQQARQAIHNEGWTQIHELGEDVREIRCVRARTPATK